MDKKCIVIFLTDDIAQTYDGRPLMLQDALFCPVLNWCMRAWTEKGIGRFFVVCDPEYHEAVTACFPEEAAAAVGTLDTYQRDIEEYARGCWIEEIHEAMLPVGSMMLSFHTVPELARLQQAVKEDIAAYHQNTGVNILDPATTYIDPRVTIGAGTVCMTGEGVRFSTTEDVVLPSGALYADAPAMALEPGKQGNVAAGSVTIMAAMPVGIKACTNPEAFSGGDDEEDDSSLRRRLLDSYLRLPNGANAAYYEQTALSRTGVAAALAVRCPRGVGSVDLYVATDAGIPDQDLLRELNDYLQEKREISVDLRVLAPRPLPININVAIQRAGSATFEKARADADAALRSVFTGAMLGKEVTLAFLGNLLYSQESIQNYRLTSPTADLAASPTVLPCLGSVTITEWSGK